MQLCKAQEQRVVLRTGSVSVAYVAPDAYMQIDAASVEALEIIQPLQVPSRTLRAPAQ
jgi:hypothetical protein